jgi:PAS domain S-box-containing protein
LNIAKKLILSYVVIGIIISMIGVFVIESTKISLHELEGNESINLANNIGDVLVKNIDFRLIESKELGKNQLILQELKESNSYFQSLPDPESIIDIRDAEWRNNFSEDNDFINSVITSDTSKILQNKINFYTEELNSVVLAEIFVTNSYGVNIGQTGKTSDYKQNDETWWQLSDKNNLHVSSLNYDESSEVYSIDISHKITDDSGTFMGVMKTVLNSQELFEILSSTKQNIESEDLEIYLIDQNGQILFTTSNNPIGENSFKNFQSENYGFVEDGSKFISTSRSLSLDSINDSGLKIVLEHTPEIIFSSVNDLMIITSVGVLSAIAIAMIVGLYVSRIIVIPLRALSDSSNQLASGELNNRIVIESNDELGDLGRKFEMMRQKLKIKNESLGLEIKRRSKRLADYKFAIDKHSLVSITDKKGDIVYVNEKFCDVSKFNAEELIGRNHRILKSDHHPKEFFDGIWSVITHGGVWKGDIKNKAKDGSYYWVKSVIAPLYDDDGNINEYIAIRTDITTQKSTEIKLQKALEDIRENEKMKDEFSSMISHELKTPLTPIRGYCEMLKLKLAGPVTEKQIQILGRVENNVDRLERLIGDVLDSQKIDLKKMVFSTKPFLLNSFMDKIFEDLKPMLEDKGINFINNSKTNFKLNSDEMRIRQVIDNLIRNAVDFVPEKDGTVEFGASEENDSIKFYVKDNGIGISKENIDKLFIKFYQVDTSARRKHGGTGLGLVICKGIVEGLGGKIWIDSEEGKGTTVFFTIPKKDNPLKNALDTFEKIGL